MNRFERQFINKLVKLSEECGYVITEGGYIEPISDWIEQGRKFEYEVKEEENGLKIKGVEMRLN